MSDAKRRPGSRYKERLLKDIRRVPVDLRLELIRFLRLQIHPQDPYPDNAMDNFAYRDKVRI
jgi:hypothetical protein